MLSLFLSQIEILIWTSVISKRESNFPKVSNIQAYLDLYARGGRDLKQADVLLDAAIAPRWKSV